MNNRLKFRIYNTHAKEYVKNFSIDGRDKIVVFDLLSWASYCRMNKLTNLDNLILEQAVTVLDKNKKMIFEGDIVKTDSRHISIVFDATEYTAGEVRYLNEGFFLCQSGIGRVAFEKYVFCDCCPCGLEIIGNIHE